MASFAQQQQAARLGPGASWNARAGKFNHQRCAGRTCSNDAGYLGLPFCEACAMALWAIVDEGASDNAKSSARDESFAEYAARRDAADAKANVLGAGVVGNLVTAAYRGSNTGAVDGGGNRGTESTAGNLLAEGFWEYSKQLAKPADLGVMNPGGIRDDFNAGDVTFKESNTVQPFGNVFGTADYTGAQIKTILEEQWNPDPTASRPVLRLGLSSNVAYAYDPAIPVGQKVTAGKTPAMLCSHVMPAPPCAGNSFCSKKPCSIAAMTSLAVDTPGRNGSLASLTARASVSVSPGATPNAAPASTARATSSGRSRVPAPIRASGAARTMARMASAAAGVRISTSKTEMPPSTSARARSAATPAS